MNRFTFVLAAATLAAPLALPAAAHAAIPRTATVSTVSHATPNALQNVYWRRYGYWYAGRYRWHGRYWGWRRWDGGRWYYR